MKDTQGITVVMSDRITPVLPRAKGMRPRHPRTGRFDIERFALATLGVGAIIAGGILAATPAGVALITAGAGLVGWTIPYRRR